MSATGRHTRYARFRGRRGRAAAVGTARHTDVSTKNAKGNGWSKVEKLRSRPSVVRMTSLYGYPSS
jgi:hypothetical protein